MKKIIYLFTVVLFASCMQNKKESNEINIYSQRHYNVDEIQYKNFEKLTGIKVNVTKANADQLIQRMKNEGNNSLADLFITVDVGKLWQGGDMGLFQKFDDKSVFKNIDPQLLDKNGYWVPVTYRSRVIVYSNERVDKEDLSTYEDLSNEKWRGKLLVRSSSNAYNQALMSSLVENLGTENTTKWSEGVVSNFARDPKGSDRDQVKAIAAGQGDIAIVNSYYIGLLLSSQKEEEISAGNAVSVFFPNQGENERGAHINISGLALTKNAPNRENAIKLIQYLTSAEAQKIYVSNSFEYSVNPDVKPDEIVQAWGEFKKDPVDLNSLGTNRSEAIRIFDKTGWK
tara:strand:- start:8 stop:1033 length:1026 start_codon:yes stop_codon:yes gene_type:complete